MTDARLGASLPAMIAAMPPRSGVIVRPYALAPVGQTAMITAIRRVARAKRHTLLIAAREPAGYDGQHSGGPARSTMRPREGRILSMPVHDARELAQALRMRADLLLISPVWPTQSHIGAPSLGIAGFARLAQRARASTGATVIALGGLSQDRFAKLRGHGAHGWAAIDAWRNASPR